MANNYGKIAFRSIEPMTIKVHDYNRRLHRKRNEGKSSSRSTSVEKIADDRRIEKSLKISVYDNYD